MFGGFSLDPRLGGSDLLDNILQQNWRSRIGAAEQAQWFRMRGAVTGCDGCMSHVPQKGSTRTVLPQLAGGATELGGGGTGGVKELAGGAAGRL